MPGRSALITVARTVFHHAGGLQVARWINRKGFRILTYHRFSRRERLDRQCAHLRQNYSLVSMSQAAGRLEDRQPLPENALAVTVDDGYRDFHQVAYPVFHEYGIPVTVYLVSGFVDGEFWLWMDRVKYACLNSPRKQAVIALPGHQPFQLQLSSPEARRAAAFEITEAAKRLPNADRLRLVDGLPDATARSAFIRTPSTRRLMMHLERTAREIGSYSCGQGRRCFN